MATSVQSEFQEQGQPLYTRQSSSDVSLIPYTRLDGEWTLPDHFVVSVFRQIKQEKNFELVFYEGQIRSEDDFLSMMKSPANAPVFLLRNGVAAGVAWLNGFSANLAYGHFCFLAADDRDTVKMGKSIVSYWLSFPQLEFVMGVIPSFNRRAIEFVKKLGFKEVGDVPQMIKNTYGEDRAAAVILYLSRLDDV